MNFVSLSAVIMLLLNFFLKKNENDVGYSKTLPSELIRPIVHHLKNDKKSLLISFSRLA